MSVCRFLTILQLVFVLSVAKKSAPPPDPPPEVALLASFDDSDDLDLTSTPLKVADADLDLEKGVTPAVSENDDFYVEGGPPGVEGGPPEVEGGPEEEEDNEEEDLEEEEIDEDREGRILNWVKEAVGADIFEDMALNDAFLSSLPSEYSIVYPVQTRKNQVLGLDTHDNERSKPSVHFHRANINILFTDYRVKYRLKLALNRDFISRDLKQKRNIDSSTQIIEEGDAENCYYQGEVKKSPGSKVIVSTCSGISGLVLFDNKLHVIAPLAPVHPDNTTDGNWTRWPHALFELPSTERRHSSANSRGMWRSFRELHVGEYMRRRKIMMAMREHFDVMAEKKRLQLGLVADTSLVARFNGSLPQTQAHLLQVANIMDAVLREVGIRVSVKFLETWNHDDHITMDTNARSLLHHFLNYRTETMSYIGLDVVHLFTAQPLRSGEVGMAIPDSICSQRAVAVSQDFGDFDLLRTANGALHMLGHILGIAEQPENGCLCAHEGGCVMDVTANGSISHHALHLSPCARTSLEEALLGGLGSCLLEDPPRVFPYAHAFKDVFPQSCGNGRVERGEECDCLSVQECRLTDPCCNPRTCLLQPWATCRYGDCCHNCTVVPPSYMCRLAVTECDVPEFCDGHGGYCPENRIVQTGWPCQDAEGFCYQGLCQTYSDQCRLIWGPGASPADTKCYETFNTAGRFDGHCGPNSTTGDYTKCADSQVSCGLLHCAGGDSEPRISRDKTFSATTVNSGGNNYQCKILSSHQAAHFPSRGLVQDGTRCDNASLCVDRRCVRVDSLVTDLCPRGHNNLTCSGRGRCTDTAECFCYSNFTGADCSVYRKQTTFLPPTVITESPAPETTTPATSRVNLTGPTGSMSTTTMEPPLMEKAERSVSTLWLVIVLSSVAGGSLLILGFFMLCYRRKSPMDFAKKKQKKKKNPSVFGSITSFSSSNSKGSKSREDSGDEGPQGPRIISFGNMPSYRADKLAKVLRKSLGGISEQSEGSEPGEREEVSLPLARAPEKGILKYPRSSSEDLLETVPLRRVAVTPPRPPLAASRGSPLPQRGPPRPPEAEAMLARPEDDDDEECGSCCSCEDDDDKKSDSCCLDARDQQTQTDPESSAASSPTELPRDVSSDSLEGAKNKIIKLQNINELLKQIDEQFSSVLRQTSQGDVSPAASDELRGSSETEADRHFPRDSFYRQSDVEEGYSPPHRSPALSPAPRTDTLPSPSLASSPLPRVSASSPPAPLHSPLISPITARSPPILSSPHSLFSPLSAPSSMYKDPLRGPRHTTSTPTHPQPPPRPPREQSPVPSPRGATGASPRVSPKPQPRQRHGSANSSSSTPRGSPTPQPRRKHPQQAESPPDASIKAAAPPTDDIVKSPSPPKDTIPDPLCATKAGPAFGSLWSQKRQSPPKEPASPKSPPKNKNHSNNKSVEPAVTAVPYRGKVSAPGSPTPGSPTPGSPRHKSPTPSASSTDSKKHKLASPKSPGSSFLTKLAQGLDGNRFKRRGSQASEGSDVAGDDAVIVREIPARKPVELPFMPSPSGAYTKAPGSPGSPEDINV